MPRLGFLKDKPVAQAPYSTTPLAKAVDAYREEVKPKPPQVIITERKTVLPQGPEQLFFKCKHYDIDDKGVCNCPSMARTGPLAKMIGSEPACILIGAPDSKRCTEFAVDTSGPKENMWSTLEEALHADPNVDEL